MEKLKELAKQLNILPVLRLGNKLAGGGVKSTGAHKVKFLAEPIVVMGKDFQGKPRKELRFEVEENGIKYRWNVPILNKENQPNYLVERLMPVQVGDEMVLEMVKKGLINYIDVRKEDEAPGEIPEEGIDEPEEIEGGEEVGGVKVE